MILLEVYKKFFFAGYINTMIRRSPPDRGLTACAEILDTERAGRWCCGVLRHTAVAWPNRSATGKCTAKLIVDRELKVD